MLGDPATLPAVTNAVQFDRCVGTTDVLFITLDTLRYDVAVNAHKSGSTPNLTQVLGGWEERCSPGNFTFSAHAAFFAGFLPTPVAAGTHRRNLALEFEGSETIGPGTAVLSGETIVEGFAREGYRTICIGGTGFFNKRSSLGRCFPALFDESHWSEEMGVTGPDSARVQVAQACTCLAALPRDQRAFLFINVSAIHQPNCSFLPDADTDSLQSHAAALHYVDRCLPPLFAALQRRGTSLVIACSDHGTAYGEDGHYGHRNGHPVVWTVPYAHALLPHA